MPIHINANDLNKYDKNRVCEIEEIYHGWILYAYFQKKEKIKFDTF